MIFHVEKSILQSLCFTILSIGSMAGHSLPCCADEPQVIIGNTYQYEPAAENLAARRWFQDAKFGIFIHWGVYSELGRGEWVMHNEKMTTDEYQPLAEKFDPQEFDPAKWVGLFKRAGAKYITITSKHHDGFAMWDSDATDWDIVDATPYGKDILKPLAKECEEQGLPLFFYHSHLDWTHPDYFPRGQTGKHSGRSESGDFSQYLEFMNAQLAELLSGEYGDVAGIWFDGWWDQRDKSSDDPKATLVDWDLPRTYKLIHELQPACLVGNNHHVAPFAGEDFQMFERDLPGKNVAGHSADAVIGDLPLETCDTINKSWGYNASDDSVKSTKELIHYLVRAAGQNANLLLNVGPKPNGTIQKEFVERLEEMGDWLDAYGETIYGSRGGPVEPQNWGVSTRKQEDIYLHLLDTPEPDQEGWIELSGTTALADQQLKYFGRNEPVEYRRSGSGAIQVRLPSDLIDAIDVVLVMPASN